MDFLPLFLAASLLSGVGFAQTGDFENCSPGPIAPSCAPETWIAGAGLITVEPFAPIVPQLGFPTKGAQWTIMDATGASGFLTIPGGGPAPYPLTAGSTASLVFKNMVISSSISFDYNYVSPECPNEAKYNDFFTVDIVDPVTGKQLANIHYQDTWSTNYDAAPAVTPAASGFITIPFCSQTREVAPVGTAKSISFAVPVALIGGVYNLEFHVGNGGDSGVSGYAWVDNILNGTLGPLGTCTYRTGVLGLNPDGYSCVTLPGSGQVWSAWIDMVPTIGSTSFQSMVVIGFSGPLDNFSILGYELLTVGPYFIHYGLGSHSLLIPQGLGGLYLATQGARIEFDSLGVVHIVLLNAQDLVIG